MKIYLAGSVPKGDQEAKAFKDWRKEYGDVIKKTVLNSSSFNPVIFAHLEGDSLAVTGADCLNIKDADLVIVNSEQKLGAGTAMELVVAKYLNKPVITVLPKNTHHRRSNVQFEGKLVKDWIHPFIETFSDIVIESISELDKAMKFISKHKIKNITIIDEAIQYAENILKD